MRSAWLSIVLVVGATATTACGGGIAPTTDQQTGSSGSSGGSSTGSGSGSGSDDGSNNSTSNARICTPGNYVFCRCADRSEGTKLCRENGASFDACSCDHDTPPVCAYPPPSTPPGCPQTYSHSNDGTPCPVANLTCSYPGFGLVGPDGCASTATLTCLPAPGGGKLFWSESL